MRKIIVILCILLCLCGCNKNEYQKGMFDNLTYTNTVFNFTMSFPEKYEIFTDERILDFLGINTEDLQSDVVYEYIVTVQEQMPLFQFNVERYKFTTLITFDDFVAQVVQQFLDQKEYNYTIGSVCNVEFNGVMFKKIPMQMNVGNYTLYQDIYLINNNGYVGTLMIMYADTQIEEVQEIMKSIQLFE